MRRRRRNRPAPPAALLVPPESSLHAGDGRLREPEPVRCAVSSNNAIASYAPASAGTQRRRGGRARTGSISDCGRCRSEPPERCRPTPRVRRVRATSYSSTQTSGQPTVAAIVGARSPRPSGPRASSTSRAGAGHVASHRPGERARRSARPVSAGARDRPASTRVGQLDGGSALEPEDRQVRGEAEQRRRERADRARRQALPPPAASRVPPPPLRLPCRRPSRMTSSAWRRGIVDQVGRLVGERLAPHQVSGRVHGVCLHAASRSRARGTSVSDAALPTRMRRRHLAREPARRRGRVRPRSRRRARLVAAARCHAAAIRI